MTNLLALADEVILAGEKATEENWKHVVGYEGLYEVSDHGNVRGVQRTVRFIRRGAETQRAFPAVTLRSMIGHKGYPQVTLCANGKSSSYPIHRLVLLAFVGPKPEGMHGAHLNGIKTDNRLINLAWVSASENERHKSCMAQT